VTDFRLWRLSQLKPAPPPDDADTPAARATALLAALRTAKGLEPPDLPPEGSPARAIIDAVKKARGQK